MSALLLGADMIGARINVKQTSLSAVGTSAMCQQRTSCHPCQPLFSKASVYRVLGRYPKALALLGCHHVDTTRHS